MKRLMFSMVLVGVMVFGGTVRADSIVTFGTGSNAFGMVFVPIGNPNNLPDTREPNATPSGAGAVGYDFQMGKFEVSEDMITKFNNWTFAFF